MQKDYKPWKIFIKLSRFYLSLAVAFSGFVGFILYKPIFNWKALLTFLGILFLASAASAFNQYQERNTDKLMMRTKNRPLPSKKITLQQTLILIIILGLFGFLFLFLGTTITITILGALNIFWYNAIYTPLKRNTKYAIFIGALCGAIPPIMGWIAAGGYLFNYKILSLAFFMYMWQIPHVLLLVLKYKNEYKLAGFPSILTISISKNKVIIISWLILTTISTLCFFPLHIFSNFILIGLLILLNIIIILNFYYGLFFKKSNIYINHLLHTMHFYQLTLFALLIIQILI